VEAVGDELPLLGFDRIDESADCFLQWFEAAIANLGEVQIDDRFRRAGSSDAGHVSTL